MCKAQLTISEPTLFIAIGGGGFIPARILRTFLKTTTEGKKRNIPIQAVGLTLYESMGGVSLASCFQGAAWRDTKLEDELGTFGRKSNEKLS